MDVRTNHTGVSLYNIAQCKNCGATMSVIPTYCISSKEFDDVQCCCLPEFYWITNRLPMKFGVEDCVLIELDDNDDIPKPGVEKYPVLEKQPVMYFKKYGRQPKGS